MSESNGHSNSPHGGLTDWMTVNRVQRIVNQAISTQRQEWARRSGDPRRDVLAECGYPPVGGENKWLYLELYSREAVAARVVEVMPAESWQVTPWVYETEDSDEATELEQAWDSVGRALMPGSRHDQEEGSPVWDYCERLDVASGIGSYGVMLIGVTGGSDLSSPAFEIDARGTRKGKPQVADLLYLRVFPEHLAVADAFESNPASPRFGQPAEYSITFNDPREGYASGVGAGSQTRKVHWTRVLHVPSDGGFSSCEWAAPPRMRPVLNNILGLQKLYCSSPEMFWKGAYPGLTFETHPTLGGDVDVNLDEMRRAVEDYENSLTKMLLGKGGAWKNLAPTVVDPTAQIAAQVKAICIKMGIPVPVFEGYEIGEQASTENRKQWDDRLKRRQNRRITPRSVAPLVDRLIDMGCLPEPKRGEEVTANALRRLAKRIGQRDKRLVKGRDGKILIANARGQIVGTVSPGGFCVEWPDITAQSATEKAAIFAQRMTAYGAYASGGVENVMTPMDMLSREAGYDEEEAASILENAAAAAEEKMEEQAQAQEQQAALQAEQVEAGAEAVAGQEPADGQEPEGAGPDNPFAKKVAEPDKVKSGGNPFAK